MKTIFINIVKPIVCLCLIAMGGCRKLVEIPVPTNSLAESNVYTTDATAISVLSGIYLSMNTNPIQGPNGSIAMLAGMSADELTLSPIAANETYFNYNWNRLSQSDLNNNGNSGGELWAPLYSFIFRCNAAIEGLSDAKASSLTPAVRTQLLGEAKFMRAFFYFYLVNCFGDVPLAITTDPKINSLLSRASQDKVYEQIIADLTDAKQNLRDIFLDATLVNTTTSVERVRPTKWAAAALLARAYLYTNQWAKAEAEAGAVISHSTLFTLLPNLNTVFNKNSKEAIWQIQPTGYNVNTLEGNALVIPSTGPGYGQPVILNQQLSSSFEPGDQRAVYGNWMDTTIYKLSTNPVKYDTVAFPFKYKVSSTPGINSVGSLTEYFMVLRLAEQYLIRAEARVQQNNIGGAQSDLNAIRNRAGLANTTAADQTSLMAAILDERRHELFTEWGNRWFDLKRTDNINAVMTIATPLKSGGATNWQSYQQLYPLPYNEILNAPNLVQNAGY